MSKICSFFGHRKINESNDLYNKVYNIIIDLVEKEGVDTFYFGGFGEFDDLCYAIVSKLKEKYCFIQRIYCLEDIRYINPLKRPKYLKSEDYESFIYLPLSYDYCYTRIYYRNCAMIDSSDYVVFYAMPKNDSGAYKALKYAIRTKKPIVNLYDN